jgi:hypothetical protein
VIVLATAGFLAEVVGVGLIVLDIRDSRRQAKRIMERPQHARVYPETAEGRALALDVSGGTEPSIGDRVAVLEARQRELDDRLVTGLSDLRGELRADTSQRTRHLEEDVRADYEVLQDVLRDMLTGSLGRRMWGVVLVVMGVAASWAANLVSALAAE